MKQQFKRRLGSAVFFFSCLMIASIPAYATPMTWGDSIIKPLSWKKNSIINVYIQPDPKNEGRDVLLKEGVERWKDPLSQRMITVNVTIGNPPVNAENAVHYTFDADGFMAVGRTLGPGDLDNGIGVALSDGTEILAGEVHIRDALGSSTDMDKDRLRNLGEHEFTHVLGLADDDNGSVTNHSQPTAPRNRNEQDIKELNTLYGTAATGGTGKPTGAATPTQGGNAFTYTFLFTPANVTADLSDAEHIALITMGIDPSLVTSVDLPPGWIGLIPTGPVSRTDPFFTEGYMLDGAGDIPPWDPLNPMNFIAFRTSVAEALADGLPAGTDPALSLLNPSLNFTVYTTAQSQTGDIFIWAGGNLQQVTGPVAPEPTSVFLLGLGLPAILLRRKSKQTLRED